MRYPSRVRRWYFCRFLSLSLTVIVRQPRLEFGCVGTSQKACALLDTPNHTAPSQGLRSSQVALAQPEKDDRGDDEDVKERADHAAKHRGGKRSHELRPGACRPQQGQQPGYYSGHGHHFGTEAQERAFHDGLMQAGQRERAVGGGAAGDGFFEVDDHDDAGLHRGSEECDEADPYGDREVEMEKLDQENAAGEREGDGEQDVRGFPDGTVGAVKQDEDDE